MLIDNGFARGLTVDPLASDPSSLNPGDVVIAVDDLPVDRLLSRTGLGGAVPRPGSQWHYQVLRDGETVDVPSTCEEAG